MTSAIVKRPMEIEAISNDTLFEMRRHDWEMLKRMVNRVPKQSKFLSNAYSLFFGIGATTLSILLTTQEFNPTINIVLISTTISTIVLGVILVILDKQNSKRNKDAIDEINVEISEIEKLCKGANQTQHVEVIKEKTYEVNQQ